MHLPMTPAASHIVLAALLLPTGARASPSLPAQVGDVSRQIPSELRSYVERFTGGEPADCGHYALVRPLVTASAEDLERSVTCAVTSAKDRKPFLAFKQEQGIDSLVFRGIVGTVEGTVYYFSYDSAPCGGPGCPGQITIERCDKPIVRANETNAEFRCQR